MTSSPPGLLDMPDNVLDKILDQDKFRVGIYVLRKVCHALRDYIDYKKPDPRIKKLLLTIKSDAIQIYYDLHHTTFGRGTVYTVTGDYCTLQRGFRPGKPLKTDILTTVILDLAVSFKLQKSIFEEFRINLEGFHSWITVDPNGLLYKFYEKFQEILEKNQEFYHLKVEKLVLPISKIEEFQKILPYLDQKFLKKIDIGRINGDYPKTYLKNFEIISKSAFFENLDYLRISNFWLDAPLMDFVHIKCVNVNLKKIYFEELRVLREHLLKFPDKYFRFCYRTFNHKREFSKFLGPNFTTDPFSHKRWHFRTTVPGRILRITVNKKEDAVEFHCLDQEMMPEDIFVN